MSTTPTLVVVGTGMAGAKVVEEVIAREPDRFHIRMFGAEPHGTYNRILLSSVLGGFKDTSNLWLNPMEWYEDHGVRVHAGVKADVIDRDKQVVIGADGKVTEPYDALVLATGSRPFVPPMDGLKQQGVFVFRTLEDCDAIAAYARQSKRAVVIGGGLLGLEAARGLLSYDVRVTVVEVAPHLMIQQLDPLGGALLKRTLEGLGVEVLLEKATTAILGDGRVTGLRFKDGSTLDADMVVISCGIRPNVDEAKAAGLKVEKAIVVDDKLRTSDPAIFAVGECVQHKGRIYGLVDPLYEQARVLADVLTGAKPQAAYNGSRLGTVLKVMGVDLTAMGEVNAAGPDCEVVSHLDPAKSVYKKLILRDRKLVGAILLGQSDPGGRLMQLFKSGETLTRTALEMLTQTIADGVDIRELLDDTQICNCNTVTKGTIVEAIRQGKRSIATIGECTRAGTGCGSCQIQLAQLIEAYAEGGAEEEVNKVEVMKAEQDGLDSLPTILCHAETGNWQEMTEDDKQRAKWHGLFFRKQTPGNFMMRIRSTCGAMNARQWRVIADLSDQYGKGFCDLTTRQQVQMRWFTIADVPDIWKRLEAVGLNSKQTGMDNIRGVCGCPIAGLSAHELFDAAPTARAFTSLILDNKAFTNLPRKFNVTITGCLENCCHTETQDIALVPSYRELDGAQVNGFNVFAGGKQGSGGYMPARPLDIFVTPEDAPAVCGHIVEIFRDHGARVLRTRSRLAFLIQDRGVPWFRAELEKRWGKPFHKAGPELRKKHHVDHLGIHPQRKAPRPSEERGGGEGSDDSPQLYYVGALVPVGRVTTAQMRAVADVADCYGNGDIRLTVQQNLVIPNVPEHRLGALTAEPIFQELSYDPSPVMRGLVSCVGSDYCHFALIETKGWALKVARGLEERTKGKKIAPLSIHWSGCPAGCGMHQVATIGLQGVRSRVNGDIVDAAHVHVDGKSGPKPQLAKDLMYDLPCEQLVDALEPLVRYLPRG
jgi:nitrite reductase (NADH) large subunit